MRACAAPKRLAPHLDAVDFRTHVNVVVCVSRLWSPCLPLCAAMDSEASSVQDDFAQRCYEAIKGAPLQAICCQDRVLILSGCECSDVEGTEKAWRCAVAANFSAVGCGESSVRCR
jgi:hypothetical protein